MWKGSSVFMAKRNNGMNFMTSICTIVAGVSLDNYPPNFSLQLFSSSVISAPIFEVPFLPKCFCLAEILLNMM